MLGITLSAVIGGVGQWFEERAKERAEADQVGRLERAAARFSGHLIADITVTVPMDQPGLASETRSYDKEMTNALVRHPDLRTDRELPNILAVQSYAGILANATFRVSLESALSDNSHRF